MAKKNFIHGFYPQFKLAECCSDDQFRPVLDFLHVKGGYVYATDARIAVRANLRYVSNLSEDEIALLDDKLIPSKTFKELQKCEAITVTVDGIVAEDELKKTTYKFIGTKDADEVGYHFPNVEAIFSEHSGNVYREEHIGLSPARLARLANAIGATGGASLSFTGDGQAIIVRDTTDKDNENVGIIMPIRLED